VIRAEDVGINPEEVGGQTVFTYQIESLQLVMGQLAFFESPGKDIPLQWRLSNAPAAALLDGSGDPQAMFEALISGPLIAEQTFPWADFTGPETTLFDVRVPLSDAFIDSLNDGNYGRLVFSFNMPFLPDEPVDRGDGHELARIPNSPFDVRLEAGVNLQITPVPEPGTYGAFGAVLIVGVIAWQRLRRRAA
jgi:hypothetical protein